MNIYPCVFKQTVPTDFCLPPGKGDSARGGRPLWDCPACWQGLSGWVRQNHTWGDLRHLTKHQDMAILSLVNNGSKTLLAGCEVAEGWFLAAEWLQLLWPLLSFLQDGWAICLGKLILLNCRLVCWGISAPSTTWQGTLWKQLPSPTTRSHGTSSGEFLSL